MAKKEYYCINCGQVDTNGWTCSRCTAEHKAAKQQRKEAKRQGR